MPLTPALIQFDNGQAVREGWDVFETTPTGAPLQIQRNDESTSFDSDAEALAFVFNSAFDGSDYHKTALALHLGLYAMTEAPAADPLSAPAREAVVKVTDDLRNVAYVRWTEHRGWGCTLANGIPASMFYAGCGSDHDTEVRIALDRAKTVGDVLRVMKGYVSTPRHTVELV